MSLDDTEYLAISHVWGNASWQQVPGIEGEVLVSDEKAKFLGERLRLIVNSQYFWMDVLCIDQHDHAARVAITQYIPEIFRRAERTIVLREGTGFRSCCEVEWDQNQGFNWDWLLYHCRKSHSHEYLSDGVITRLWLLQEALLSNNLQFEQCPSPPIGQFRTPISGDFAPYLDNLKRMGEAWASYGDVYHLNETFGHRLEGIGKLIDSFIRAYFSCGTVSRSPVPTPKFPLPHHISSLLSSTRKTSHPRDFILAVMPQFSFYVVPPDAKRLNFQQLYLDCCQQLVEKHSLSCDVGPQIPVIRSLVESGINTFPEPRCLGDVAKLFSGPKSFWISDGTMHPVSVELIKSPTLSDVVHVIRWNLRRSLLFWPTASMSELVENRVQLSQSRYPGCEAQLCADVVMEIMRISDSVHSELRNVINALGKDNIVRSAALIACGFGISSFEWSKSELSIVSVKFRGRLFLGLVPKSIQVERGGYVFKIAELKHGIHSVVGLKIRYILLACDESGRETLCYFPSDVDVNKWKFWKKYMEQKKENYLYVLSNKPGSSPPDHFMIYTTQKGLNCSNEAGTVQ